MNNDYERYRKVAEYLGCKLISFTPGCTVAEFGKQYHLDDFAITKFEMMMENAAFQQEKILSLEKELGAEIRKRELNNDELKIKELFSVQTYNYLRGTFCSIDLGDVRMLRLGKLLEKGCPKTILREVLDVLEAHGMKLRE